MRTPDNDERHPWHIPLDRPCLLCYLEQNLFKPDMTLPPGGGVQYSRFGIVRSLSRAQVRCGV